MVQKWVGEVHMNRGKVGEERGGKEQMDVPLHLAVITCVITFPLEILEMVIPHATMKDLFNFIFILAIKDSWGWGRGMSMTCNGVREH
jgi:hypothetical protein